jgi:hypothetical protein
MQVQQKLLTEYEGAAREAGEASVCVFLISVIP